LALDETSSQKRNESVTVLTDRAPGNVVHVADDRKQATLGAFLDTLTAEERTLIESVARGSFGFLRWIGGGLAPLGVAA
jgi:transposase